MMRITLFAAFLCLAAALPNTRQVQNLASPDRIPGEFLVVLHPHVGKSSNFVYANEMAGRIARFSEKIHIVNIFYNLQAPILHVKTTDEGVMSQLFALDEVDAIDSNLHQNMIQQCSSQSTGSRIWGLSRASNRSPDFESATYSYSSSDGSGVRVYILDTGIMLTHQDFSGRGEFGANFSSDENGDRHGHGTHCAGIASGTKFGVSKSSTVVDVKIMGDNGSATSSEIIAGIDWMVEDVAERGVRAVASMSFGGATSSAMNSAVNSADFAGILVVAAAGNDNSDACDYSPGGATGAITVGATDFADNLSIYSNWGSCVNILAPGSNVLSASIESDTGSRTRTGTSMACPHVAGAVANYLADNPNASPAQVKNNLYVTATANAINLRGTPATLNFLLYTSCA